MSCIKNTLVNHYSVSDISYRVEFKLLFFFRTGSTGIGVLEEEGEDIASESYSFTHVVKENSDNYIYVRQARQLQFASEHTGKVYRSSADPY